jgi:hypothetical protein
MGGPWEDYAPQDNGPWNDYAQPQNQPANAATWSDVPGAMLQNAPQSAVNFGKNIYNAVADLPQTAQNLYDVGKGVVSKVQGLAGEKQDPNQKATDEAQANALWDFMVQRYGSEDKLRNTLATDPVGALADIAGVLSGGELMAGRLPIVGGIARAGGAVADVVDPLSATAKLATGGGKLAAKSLGLTTGVGGDAVEEAFKAGANGKKAFLDNMRGNADVGDIVDMAQQYLQDTKSAAQADYLKNTQALRAGAGAARLDIAPVENTLANTESMFKQPGGYIKNKGAAATFDDIKSEIADWKAQTPNPTPVDYDALKQAIGQIDAPNGLAESIRTQVYQSIQKQLATHVPDYAKAMSGYEDAQNNLTQLKKTFSLNPNASTDTAARKIMSILRNNVNTNFGQRAQLAQQIAQANPNFIPAIAGQTMSSIEPRGLNRLLVGGELLGAFHNPMSLAALPLSSPRLVGEGAYAAGRLSNFVPPTMTFNTLQQSGRLDQIPGLLGQ